MHIFPDPIIIAYQLIPFAVLLIALNSLVFQPMLNYLDERRKRIEGSSDLAKHLGSDSSHKEKEIAQKLASARTEVAEMRAKALRDAQAVEKQILDDARKAAEAHAATFRRELDATRSQESARLRDEVDALGTNIAGRVLGRAL